MSSDKKNRVLEKKLLLIDFLIIFFEAIGCIIYTVIYINSKV